MDLNASRRFNNHAQDYHKYRPRYPEAIITYLESNIGLKKTHAIADIGSGTGIFTELFLRNGYPIAAIEPNAEMRLEAEKTFTDLNLLKSMDGSAEHTGLADGSVDLITVAQSFHWFDFEATQKEFKRILKPGGHILLVWNILQQRSPFLKAYQELKNKYADDKPYAKQVDEDLISRFFEPYHFVKQEIYHSRLLNLDELLGYFRSSSYSPIVGESNYPTLVKDIAKLFDEFEKDGHVKLEYDTKMYYNGMTE